MLHDWAHQKKNKKKKTVEQMYNLQPWEECYFLIWLLGLRTDMILAGCVDR